MHTYLSIASLNTNRILLLLLLSDDDDDDDLSVVMYICCCVYALCRRHMYPPPHGTHVSSSSYALCRCCDVYFSMSLTLQIEN